MSIDVIVLAWYRREDYDRIYALADDGGGMEATFDDWEKFVIGVMPSIQARGVPIQKIFIKPDEFAAWLRGKNLKSTSDTRALYVHELAHRQFQN